MARRAVSLAFVMPICVVFAGLTLGAATQVSALPVIKIAARQASAPRDRRAK